VLPTAKKNEGGKEGRQERGKERRREEGKRKWAK
jgi:hypothetical protein